MSCGSSVLPTAETEHEGIKRTPCPFHGCKRVYPDVIALERHVKDHEIPAQSLPGKVLLCSTLGCSGSFPNMQKLMEHMRHHHKPNIFFLCENCRTKLRSYRGLLTHLHTCSKVPRGKTKPSDLPQSAAVTNPNMTPVAISQNSPQLDAVSTPQQVPSHVHNPDGSFPAAAAPQPDCAAPPVLTAPCFLNPEITSSLSTAPPHLTEAALQPQVRNPASSLSSSLRLEDTLNAQGQAQTQTGTLEPFLPTPTSAPLSPSGSAVIWRKNQGMACSRNVLWEHTKGRYTCVQCGYMVTNRKEMNQHISTHHSGTKPADDAHVEPRNDHA
ncbi:zinc finger protein 414 [Aulostomus maculatus]